MAVTMAQELAEHFRVQTLTAEKALRAAGYGTDQDHTGEALGSPECSLTVRGNIGDIARTNHYFYLSALESGALPGPCPPDLAAERPTDFRSFLAFLAPRETYTAEEALEALKQINGQIASEIEGLTDEQLEAPVPGLRRTISLRQSLFSLVRHGALHTGQAWGILKGAGLTTHGFESIFF